jgi:hypothetical protein
MDPYVARAHIDRYLGLLMAGDLTPHDRAVITKRLIAEANKCDGLEHLEFVESRVVTVRETVIQFTDVRNGCAFGTPERDGADKLLVDVENLQTELEEFCRRLRERLTSRGA